MTNSTDKKPKTKGPIRFEAVIPAAIVIALIGAYFHFFFDSNLRRGIEWTGTFVHGAEVNVGDINTSVFRGSFEMLNLQITDKEKPHRNIFQVGRIHFQFMWDALLRAKFVIDDASIKNIQALVPRKKPGYVRPPEPPKKDDGALAKVEKEVLDQTKKEYNENLLGDIATVLGGMDAKDQLKNIEGELKSSARIKELETELKEKQKVWQEKIKALPQGKELEALGERIKGLKFDTKKPKEFAESLKQAQKIIKEADQKVKLVSETGKILKTDLDTYNQAFKDLEKMVEQDLEGLQKRLKIPSIDGKDFSTKLFMNMVNQRLGSVRKYMEVAREYMPPKKSKEEKQQEQLIPPARGQGRNYRFPITTGYPLFWLKHAGLSSEVSQSEYSGNISGEIKDLTSDPVFLGRPTVITLSGDFPKQQIFDVNAKIVLDHTTEHPKESMNLSVGGYPFGGKKLSDSKDLQLGINEAKGQTDMNASLESNRLTVDLNNRFKEVKYDLEAKNKMVKEIVGNVLSAIPEITLNANITGTWDNIKMHINSNLGDELSKGFKQQIQAKIDEARAQLKQLIDEKIGGEKKKLTEDFDKVKGQITGELDKKKSEVDKAKTDAEKQVKGGKGSNSPTKKLEEEGKKAIKGLKKLFGK